MKSLLRILYLENDLADAELVRDTLEIAGISCDLTRVETEPGFLAALEQARFDLILADYTLPSFDGLSALKLAGQQTRDLPFIFVSGTMGEEVAIEALKIGATDYVLKTRLSRLVPSVHRALREAEERAELRRAEDALRRSEAYLAEAQTLTHTGSWAINPVTRKTIYWSEEMFRIFGLDPQQGLPAAETCWQRMHSEDRDRIRESLDKAFREKADFVEDYRIVLPDGNLKDLHAIGHPVFDETGELVEYVGTSVDVTERKRAEEERERLRQLEAELVHMNRVSMMGELAASVAHEIKQPIAAAVMNAKACARWLQRDAPDLTEACQAVSRMVTDATRAANIVDRVRSLYSRGAPQREVIDVNEIIRDLTFLLRDEANRDSIAIRTELAERLPKAMADRVQVQQVLMNLMLNAIDAMRDTAGELVIKSHQTAEGQLLISVSDSGVGIPPEHVDRIFDAFFTTKPHGSGMGLAISRTIIQSHGGRLWATANAGHGAIFSFTLPATV
jgi:PAS domain S-box-containing protein